MRKLIPEAVKSWSPDPTEDGSSCDYKSSNAAGLQHQRAPITVKDIRGVLRIFLFSSHRCMCADWTISLKQCAYITELLTLDEVIYSRSTVEWSFGQAFTFRVFQGPNEFVCLAFKYCSIWPYIRVWYFRSHGRRAAIKNLVAEIQQKLRVQLPSITASFIWASAATLSIGPSAQQSTPALIIYIPLSACRACQRDTEYEMKSKGVNVGEKQ